MADSPHQRASAIKAWAIELGFDLVGITRPAPSAHASHYRAWLADKKHGEMDYLARNLEERLDLRRRFPWARSVLCLAISYWQEPPAETRTPQCESQNAPPPPPASTQAGKIARYAWGRDYHKVLERKLKNLERRIREQFAAEQPAGEKIEIRAFCDTGPLLERDLAAAAGMGWIGKNTLLIHPRHGSWFLLGELVLSLELEPDSPIPDHCGTCRRCIEACPTQAITPYSLDASKCISYLTLEHRAPIADQFQAPMQSANYLIGCDICQEVCPFNKQDRPLLTHEQDFAPRAPAPAISLQQVIAWQEQDWDILTRGRAFRRAKFPMWQRNAKILAGEFQ